MLNFSINTDSFSSENFVTMYHVSLVKIIVYIMFLFSNNCIITFINCHKSKAGYLHILDSIFIFINHKVISELRIELRTQNFINITMKIYT